MQDAWFYFRMGWDHIISVDALDHLLFIISLCVFYDFSQWKKLLILVTAFTLGHSVTLALSVLDIVRIPSVWVEFLIPCTIVFTSVVNMVRAGDVKHMGIAYSMALIFGLIHGMGFANALRMMLSRDQSLGISLLGFNLGLEAGQVLVVFVVLWLATVLTGALRIKKIYWVNGVSILTGAVALYMAFQRLPF